MVAAVLNRHIFKLQQFFKFSEAYLKRNNPVAMTLLSISEGIKNFLTMNKKVKLAKYRVNHLRYRVYQMEQIIAQGNPYNGVGGGSIDLQR